jgi:hypothetical protein
VQRLKGHSMREHQLPSHLHEAPHFQATICSMNAASRMRPSTRTNPKTFAPRALSQAFPLAVSSLDALNHRQLVIWSAVRSFAGRIATLVWLITQVSPCRQLATRPLRIAFISVFSICVMGPCQKMDETTCSDHRTCRLSVPHPAPA